MKNFFRGKVELKSSSDFEVFSILGDGSKKFKENKKDKGNKNLNCYFS